MEAAACYIGECREPVRDAKIALTAEGLFGLFVYLTLPIMVLRRARHGRPRSAREGDHGLDRRRERRSSTATSTRSSASSTFWNWFIGLSTDHRRSAALGAERAHGRLARPLPERARRDPPAGLRLGEQAQGPVVLDARSACVCSVARPHASARRCRSTSSRTWATCSRSRSRSIGYGIFRSMREDTPTGAADADVAFGPLGLIVGIAAACSSGRSAATTRRRLRGRRRLRLAWLLTCS